MAPKPLASIGSTIQFTPSGERAAYSAPLPTWPSSRLISVRNTTSRMPWWEIASVGSRPTGRPSIDFVAITRTFQLPSRRSA